MLCKLLFTLRLEPEQLCYFGHSCHSTSLYESPVRGHTLEFREVRWQFWL